MSQRRRRRQPAPAQPPPVAPEPEPIPDPAPAPVPAPEPLDPDELAARKTPVIAYGLTIVLVALLLVCALAIYIAAP